MFLLAIVLVVLLVVALGLALNFRMGRVKKLDPKEGASVQNIFVATELLAGLLLAIVLADAGASYGSARAAAKQEADVIDTLYESAEYAEMPFRQQIQADAACYARAVVGPEWKTLAKGKRSPVPNNWTGTRPGGLRATFLEMTPEAPAFGLVQGVDVERGSLRSERLTQASPTVPRGLVWFVVVLISLSLGGLAQSIPRTGNRPQLIALGLVVLTFLGAMALMYNLDRPFSGVLAIEPTAMRTLEQDISQEYQDRYKVQLPCDEQGNLRNPAAGASVGGAPAATTTTVRG